MTEALNLDVRPFGNALVATDLADDGELLSRAALLPLSKDGVLHLLHVVDPEDARDDVGARLETAAAQLEAVVRERQLGLRVSPVLARGKPFVEIVRHARSLTADLVVLGRGDPLHGRSPGTTASRVIRAADLPVLVVARAARGPYRTPLVAVDFSDVARGILLLALRATEGRPERIHVVHGYHVSFSGFTPGERARLDCANEAQAEYERLIRPFASLRLPFQRFVVEGDPRAVILAAVARVRPDLVVLGTHARSGLTHALLGSVAEWVVDNVPRDVLIARPARLSFELP